MRDFTYHAPTEIVFGKHAEIHTGDLIRKYGGTRVFLVYGGQSAVKSGLIDRVCQNIQAAGIAVHPEGGVVPNPLLSTARKMAQAAREWQADFILAVGGGSVIDTAKAVAHGVANPDCDIWDFWTKKAPLTCSLPIGNILTIAAAGSETSDSAVLTDDTKTPPTKRGITTDLNRCRFTIMDPELTMTLPPYQIGAGAADIFMHTVERYFTPLQGNHLTDELAEGLMRDIITYGPRGVEDPTDYEAMSEIMWCGSISHVGLTGIGAKGDTPRDGDWSCHQLGMALSALYDATHGATLTPVYGAWARYVMDTDPARFARLARRVYGVEEPEEAQAAQIGIQKTEEFFKALGMPLSLEELLARPVSDQELQDLTKECSYDYTRTIGTFRVLDHQDILAIYQACR